MTLPRECEVFIDGASRGNPGPSGIGAVFIEGGQTIRQMSKYLGHTTNNVAEYLALAYALQEALQAGFTTLTVKSDSELLVRQVNGQYKVRDPQLRLFHGLVCHLMQGFAMCRVEHIPRSQNRLADRAAAEAVDRVS